MVTIHTSCFITGSCLLLCLCAVEALEVAPNSVCSPICDDRISGNVSDIYASSTVTESLVCQDWEITGSNSSANGRKWKSCLTCESTSAHTDEASGESDVEWLLFNMRFALAWCVFGYPSNPNQTLAYVSCNEACSGDDANMEASLEYQVLNTTISQKTPFEYCELYAGAFTKNADTCLQCLEKVPGSTALANYIRVLQNGCQQRPAPGNGQLIKNNFDLFSDQQPPSTTSSVSRTSGIPISSATSSTSIVSVPQSSSSSSTNKSLPIGLGVGLGFTFLLTIVLGLLLFRRSSRKQRKSSFVHTQLRDTSMGHGNVRASAPGSFKQDQGPGYMSEVSGEHHLVEVPAYTELRIVTELPSGYNGDRMQYSDTG